MGSKGWKLLFFGVVRLGWCGCHGTAFIPPYLMQWGWHFLSPPHTPTILRSCYFYAPLPSTSDASPPFQLPFCRLIPRPLDSLSCILRKGNAIYVCTFFLFFCAGFSDSTLLFCHLLTSDLCLYFLCTGFLDPHIYI
jgi:hypothetical protein